MMTPFVLLALVTLGGIGLFLAMPGGRGAPGRAAPLLLAIAAALLIAALVRLTAGPRNAWLILLALVGAVGAVRMITHAQPVYSALYFILVAVSATGLLVLMDAGFLAAALLIIYGGAILVTYVFVIMLAQQSGGPRPYDRQAREPALGVFCGFLILSALASYITAGGAALPPPAPAGEAGIGSVANVGALLLTEYVVGVQLAGVLLLAAMVGAIAIARRKAALEEGRRHWEVG
jgi:NADH-quinone oxidoreductase subunit J